MFWGHSGSAGPSDHPTLQAAAAGSPCPQAVMESSRSIAPHWVRSLPAGRHPLCPPCTSTDIAHAVRCSPSCWRLILEMGTVDLSGKAGLLSWLHLELCVSSAGACGDPKNRGAREGGRWAPRPGGGRCVTLTFLSEQEPGLGSSRVLHSERSAHGRGPMAPHGPHRDRGHLPRRSKLKPNENVFPLCFLNPNLKCGFSF